MPWLPHHLLGLVDFVAAVLEPGVAAIRAALVPDLGQPFGGDRQPVEHLEVRFDRARERAAVEVVRRQGIVRRLDPELERQVEAGRRLPAARHADQDHVGLPELVVAEAVVVREREVDRLDAVLVLLVVGDAVRPPDGVRGTRTELGLERVQESFEKVEHQRVGPAEGGANVVVDQRAEDDRPRAGAGFRRGDPVHAVACLFDRIDERLDDLLEVDALELREQAVTERLGRDAGAVGHEEDRAGGWAIGRGIGLCSAISAP